MRRWAARELAGQQDNMRAVPALRQVVTSGEWYRSSYRDFHDPDWGGRTDALALLRKVAAEQATDALIEAAGSATPYVRPWAIVELSKQKDNAKAVPALKKQVEADNWHATSYRGDHDPQRGGKADALKLLRHLAPKAEVTAALCKALKGSHKDMRRWAAEELITQKDPSAIPALKERVGDEVWYERQYTNIAPDPLGGGKTAALKALRDLASDQATEPLTKALFSRFLDQRKWAADELAIQNDKAAVAALKRRVSDDLWDKPTYDNKGECADRQAALVALKALAAAEVKAALTEALKSKQEKVRAWAVKRLAEESKP
jgi:HEAT repeat protein